MVRARVNEGCGRESSARRVATIPNTTNTRCGPKRWRRLTGRRGRTPENPVEDGVTLSASSAIQDFLCTKSLHTILHVPNLMRMRIFQGFEYG